MDDSVIKVLRRNGSWSTGQDKGDAKKNLLKNKSREDDFILDEKFGILAEEIKKRMEEKNPLSNSINSKNLDIEKSTAKKSFNITEFEKKFNKLKKQLLPHLTQVEQLIYERDKHLEKIVQVDDKLDKIKNEILVVRDNYQKELDNMQKNIDFFNNSLKVIDAIRKD